MNDKNVNRTIFCDLDGVLCDFDRSFYEITGRTSDSVQDQELWAAIDAHGKAKFFSELPWMPGGQELWKFVTDNFLKVKILSALGKSDKIDKQTTQGKLAWLNHNIPTLSTDDILLVQNKHRKKHECKPGDIIIDDNLVVIQEWNSKEGIGILHRTAAETIAKLRRYV